MTKIRDWPDLSRSKAALEEYDRTQPERDAMILNARTNEDVAAWQKAEDDAITKVRDAFWEDTKDRNSRETIMKSMAVSAVRRFVEDFIRIGR